MLNAIIFLEYIIISYYYIVYCFGRFSFFSLLLLLLLPFFPNSIFLLVLFIWFWFSPKVKRRSGLEPKKTKQKENNEIQVQRIKNKQTNKQRINWKVVENEPILFLHKQRRKRTTARKWRTPKKQQTNKERKIGDMPKAKKK